VTIVNIYYVVTVLNTVLWLSSIPCCDYPGCCTLASLSSGTCYSITQQVHVQVNAKLTGLSSYLGCSIGWKGAVIFGFGCSRAQKVVVALGSVFVLERV
jgi:hypothetical protein